MWQYLTSDLPTRIIGRMDIGVGDAGNDVQQGLGVQAGSAGNGAGASRGSAEWNDHISIVARIGRTVDVGTGRRGQQVREGDIVIQLAVEQRERSGRGGR